jgi:hypothetical protein
VIDYYRKRIEHPEWTASEFQKDPSEFSLGADRGRIYRVVPDGARPATASPALDTASTVSLVAALESPNLWWRRTAQRLLVDGKHADAVPLLTSLARDRARPALGRLHALWTLDGLGRLDNSLVQQALNDPEPGVRENALRMADARLAKDASLTAAVVDRASKEPDGGVQFQLLETLGFLHGADAQAAQSSLLFAHIDDQWMQRAALTAGPGRAAQYLARALAPGSTVTHNEHAWPPRLLLRNGRRDRRTTRESELHEAMAAPSSNGRRLGWWWQASLLSGFTMASAARQRERSKRSANRWSASSIAATGRFASARRSAPRARAAAISSRNGGRCARRAALGRPHVSARGARCHPAAGHSRGRRSREARSAIRQSPGARGRAGRRARIAPIDQGCRHRTRIAAALGGADTGRPIGSRRPDARRARPPAAARGGLQDGHVNRGRSVSVRSAICHERRCRESAPSRARSWRTRRAPARRGEPLRGGRRARRRCDARTAGLHEDLARPATTSAAAPLPISVPI